MMTKYVLLFVFFFASQFSFAQDNVLWKFQTDDRVYSSPLIDKDRVYFGSGDNSFYALDKKTGKQVWVFQTNGAVHSSPAILDDLIYFGSTDGNLYAAEKNTGELVWTFQSEGEEMYDIWDYYLSDPVTHNGNVFWGSGDGYMYALDAKSGELEWKYQTGDIIHAAPVVSDSKLYFGNYNGEFFSLDSADGSVIWKFRTIGDSYFQKGEIQKAALVEGDAVYFGSRDYNIYALNKNTGRGNWNRKTGSWVISTPFAYKERVFFGTSDSHIFYGANKVSGKTELEVPVEMRVYGSAIAHNDVIYFGSFDGKVTGVDYETGKVVWEFQTQSSKENYHNIYKEEGGFIDGFVLYDEEYMETEAKIHTLGSILSTPFIDDNVIYFGSSDGYLYAVNLN
ncbi:MAG: PQQ-binding-like beta-propeller repeat protein [Gracilimonas sp.]